MKNNIHKRINIIILVTAILAVTVFIIGAADGLSPGTEQDPIVTQSYVEQKTEQMKYYIDTLINKMNETQAKQTADAAKAAEDITALKTALDQKNQEVAKLKEDVAKLQQGGGASSGVKFAVVKLEKGKTMLTGEGAEIIVRSGKSTAIFGANGGLSDVTDGKDLKSGESIVKYHMLVSARNDGRGIKAVEESYYLVKGEYTIK